MGGRVARAIGARRGRLWSTARALLPVGEWLACVDRPSSADDPSSYMLPERAARNAPMFSGLILAQQLVCADARVHDHSSAAAPPNTLAPAAIQRGRMQHACCESDRAFSLLDDRWLLVHCCLTAAPMPSSTSVAPARVQLAQRRLAERTVRKPARARSRRRGPWKIMQGSCNTQPLRAAVSGQQPAPSAMSPPPPPLLPATSPPPPLPPATSPPPPPSRPRSTSSR